jgi:hypothetical protein
VIAEGIVMVPHTFEVRQIEFCQRGDCVKVHLFLSRLMRTDAPCKVKGAIHAPISP